MPDFEVVSPYSPAGDQPEAIAALAAGIAGLLTSYYIGSSAGASITLYLAIFFAVTFCFRKQRL